MALSTQASMVSTAVDVKNAVNHGKKNIEKQVKNYIRQEITTQTDQDTGKVVYVTKQSFSTIGTIASIPFASYNVDNAMTLTHERAAALDQNVFDYAKSQQVVLSNPTKKMASIKPDSGIRYVQTLKSDTINKYIESDNLTFKVNKDAQFLRPDYAAQIEHQIQEIHMQASVTQAVSATRNANLSGMNPVMSAFNGTRQGISTYIHDTTPVLKTFSNLTSKEEITKSINAFSRANDIAKKAEATKAALPKSLGMSVFRLATIPMQKSETMKGMNMGTTALRGVVGARTAIVRPAINLTYNAGARIVNNVRYRQVKKLANSTGKVYTKKEFLKSGKAIEKIKFRNLASRNPLVVKIQKAPLRVLAKGYDASAQFLSHAKMFENTKNLQSYLHGRASLMRNYAKGVNELTTKKAYKAAIKETRKAAINAAVKAGSRTAKAYEVIGNKFNVFAQPFKAFGRIIGKPFNLLSQLLTKLKDLLKNALKALIKPALAVAGTIAALIAFMYLITLCAYCIDLVWGRIWGVFSLSESKQFKSDANAVFKEIQECHNDFVTGSGEFKNCGIKDMYDKKGVKAVDFIYPNGTKENYKEVWSGVSVMTQGGIGKSDYSAKDLKFVANHVYKQTHKLSSRDYPFVENNGIDGIGTHVYIDILRGEGYAYEILALEDSDVVGKYPTVEFDTNDWMNIVKGVKRAVASTGKAYNSSDTAKIVANSGLWDVRLDGSGYVSACLRFYGAMDRDLSRYDLHTRSSLHGFTKMNFTGWESLKPGDIIISDKSCGVFACTVGNYHYVYDNSDGGKLESSTPSTDNSLTKYTVVWRPINPGDVGAMLTDEEWTEDEKKVEDILIDKHPLFSNMPEMNKETLNEDGYEVSMKATIDAIIDNPDIFSKATYDGNKKNHLMEIDKKTKFFKYNSTKNLSSLDFIKYVYAQHGIRVPVDFERAITSMGDSCAFDKTYLLPGDLVWYIPMDPKIDKLLILANEKLNGALSMMGTDYTINVKYTNQADDEGTDHKLGEMCMDLTIPLIYAGDGKFISYGHNVLQPIYQITSDGLYTTTSNTAGLYTYNFEDLSRERVWRCVRPKGGTIRPVYGAQHYFEGWTDSNITALMVLVDDKCWDYKTADMTTKGEFLDGEDATLDWSWYEEGNFKIEDDSWKFYSSNDHIANVRADVCQELMTYYDQYGILPGAGFALACALSDVMTTEESLLYYNIYELYADDGATDAAEVLKYIYDSYGNVTEEVHSYRKYTNYHDAIADYANEIKNSGAIGLNDVLGGRNEISIDIHDEHTSVKQLNDMWLKGLITNQASNRASRYLASFRYQGSHDVIEKYDRIARERRECMENADMLNRKAFEVAGTLSAAGHPERDMYYELCTLINDYMDQVEKLQGIDKTYGTSTSYSQAVIRRYNESIDTLKNVAKEAYARYDAAPAEEYMDYYECHGYTPAISVGKLGITASLPQREFCHDAGEPNHSSSSTCENGGSHSPHKEEWTEMSKHW